MEVHPKGRNTSPLKGSIFSTIEIFHLYRNVKVISHMIFYKNKSINTNTKVTKSVGTTCTGTPAVMRRERKKCPTKKPRIILISSDVVSSQEIRHRDAADRSTDLSLALTQPTLIRYNHLFSHALVKLYLQTWSCGCNLFSSDFT